MFKKVYIEEHLKNSSKVESILNKVKYHEILYIEKTEDVWGRVKKPYLQKRENLNLFIGEKRGQLVKEAPDAYGHGKEKHFYFIHAYNCIYECQYCYLQGYFHTPDIVIFINHDDITNQIEKLIQMPENKDAWFHAGEYSDSLSLTHITGELETYFDFFKKHPEAKLELRTKAVNIRELLKLNPLPNVYVSFTMSSSEGAKAFDYKCPSVKSRLTAIKKLVQHGFNIGLHFDPMIYHEDFEEGYLEVINSLSQILPDKQLGYISIGVVRFTKDVFKEVNKNYKDSKLLTQDYTKSFDGKVRYNMPMRMWMMNKVKNLCLNAGYGHSKIYLCMEDE